MQESMRERFYRLTAQILDNDDRAAVVLADIGVSQLRALGVFDRHPGRAINVGIREQLMVSVAAGMALEGMRPIAHSYAPFLVERPFEQVKLDFAHQALGAVLVSVGASHDWASGGRTHQSPGDVALISSLPGWTIYVPGHADEAEGALLTAMATRKPVYLRLAEQANGSPVRGALEGIVTVRQGDPGIPAILVVGPMLDRVLEAAADIDVTVLYTARPRPFDAEGLRRQVTGAEVVLVEPYLQGTSTADVVAALDDRPTRILSLGVPHEEHRHYGTYDDYDHAFGLDLPGLRARIEAFMAAPVAASA